MTDDQEKLPLATRPAKLLLDSASNSTAGARSVVNFFIWRVNSSVNLCLFAKVNEFNSYFSRFFNVVKFTSLLETMLACQQRTQRPDQSKQGN